jgi:hypothetical protein
VAINEPNGRGSSRTRGTGAEKETVAVDPDLDAPPHAADAEASGSNAPDPARGGCMRLGWGCLPVAGFLMALPSGLLF